MTESISISNKVLASYDRQSDTEDLAKQQNNTDPESSSAGNTGATDAETEKPADDEKQRFATNNDTNNDNNNGSKDTERKRLDPTRYGDWEKNGRCIDF